MIQTLISVLLFTLSLAAPAEALVQYQTRLSRSDGTTTAVDWRTDVPATHQVRYGLTLPLTCTPPAPAPASSEFNAAQTKAEFNAEHLKAAKETKAQAPTSALAATTAPLPPMSTVCSKRSTPPVKKASETDEQFETRRLAYRLVITKLMPNTDYYVQLMSWDAANVETVSPVLTMSTRIRKNYPLPSSVKRVDPKAPPGACVDCVPTGTVVEPPGPPRWSNHISYPSNTHAHMQWMFNTDKGVCTWLEYGTKPDFSDALRKTAKSGHSHYDLYQLHADTFYFFRATSMDFSHVKFSPIVAADPAKGWQPGEFDSKVKRYEAEVNAIQCGTAPPPAGQPRGHVVEWPTLIYRTNKAKVPAPVSALTRWLASLVTIARAEAAAPTIIDTGFDKIPNFAFSPTIVTVKDGMADDPDSWNPRRLPLPSDVTNITHTLTTDNGLTVKVLGIGPGGALRGSGNIRICDFLLFRATLALQGTGLIEFRPDCALDLENDPSQYGVGLLAIDSDVSLEGEPKTPWVRLATEAKAGDRTLTLAVEPEGWLPGDRAVLSGTNQASYAETLSVKSGIIPVAEYGTRRNPGPARKNPQDEVFQIASVSGKVVTLATPLRYNHLAARDPDGVLPSFRLQIAPGVWASSPLTPHVGNLTRSMVIRTAPGAKVRGHVLLTGRSQDAIRYVEFADLGRTTVSSIDSTSFDSDGHVSLDPATGRPKYGANHVGRYSGPHEHHKWGVRGARGPPFVLEGNVIRNGLKWAIALHDSHDGFVLNNVIYNIDGAGIVTEDGSESRNTIAGNLVIRINGSGFGVESRSRSGAQLGHEGVGLWFRGANNIVEGNVVAQAQYSGLMWFQLLGPLKARIPKFPGADPRILSESDVLNVPLSVPIRFAGNEVYASVLSGFELWMSGTQGPQVWTGSDLVLWHNGGSALTYNYATDLRIDGLIVRGDVSRLTSDPKGNPRLMTGHVEKVSWQLSRVDVQGLRTGLDARAISQTLTDATLRNEINLRVRLAEGRDNRGFAQLTPWTMALNNVRSMALPGKPARHIEAVWTGTPANLVGAIGPTTIRATNWNGESFTIYHRERVAEFIIPGKVTAKPQNELTPGVTNEANIVRLGRGLLGPLTPCRSTRAGYVGFVCP